MGTCVAARADGLPCRARAQVGSDYCFWHDPSRREDMLEAAKKGGSRKTIELPEVDELTASQARRVLASMVETTLKGELDARTAKAVGYLLQIEAKIRESDDMERRLREVEAVFEEAKELWG